MTNQGNLELSDIDEKIKQIAEKENISFLKTLLKFKNKGQLQNVKNKEINNKPEINGFKAYDNLVNKIDRIEKQEDDSKSYIKEILEICSNNPVISNSITNNNNSASDKVFQNKKVQLEGNGLNKANTDADKQDFTEISAKRRMLGDNSISSIQSLEQESKEDIKIHFENQPKTDSKSEFSKEEDNNTHFIQKGLQKVNTKATISSNRSNKKKPQFFNNKKNIKDIEELIKETKKIEADLKIKSLSTEKFFKKFDISSQYHTNYKKEAPFSMNQSRNGITNFSSTKKQNQNHNSKKFMKSLKKELFENKSKTNVNQVQKINIVNKKQLLNSYYEEAKRNKILYTENNAFSSSNKKIKLNSIDKSLKIAKIILYDEKNNTIINNHPIKTSPKEIIVPRRKKSKSLPKFKAQNKKSFSLTNTNITPIENKTKIKQFVVIQNNNKQFFVREKIDGDYFASQITKGEK